jgi:putative ABC transport system ATP-binding protein
VRENGHPAVIEIDRVSKTHESGGPAVSALHDVSFDVHDGEYVAIMGPSGSGKTTLLGILGCLDRPSSGAYRLVGQDVTALGEARRAHIRGERIGFVFQAYNLLPRLTAYKNVELPLVYAGVPARVRKPRVLAALDEVGLAKRVDHRPNQLSGGEQQRVAIARALVVRPSVVLADEPTGNLDSSSAEDVLQIFDRVSDGGATIVMVTHSEEVARRACRIVRLGDGKLVSDTLVGRPVAVGAAG